MDNETVVLLHRVLRLLNLAQRFKKADLDSYELAEEIEKLLRKNAA